jgi:hypothetical protein
MSKSSVALSNLRAYAILMVLAFHSVIAYLGSQPASALPFDSPPYGWTINPIVDSARWFGFDLFCAFQYVHLMHLMFFLSGLFVWPSLLRKGARAFLHDRVLRLGVPFLLGAYLLMPLAYYPVFRVTAADPSVASYWASLLALPFWPSGPMWFLWLLLALNILAAGIYCLAPRLGPSLDRLSANAGASPGGFFIALVSISALAYLPMSALFKPWQWVELGPFALQPSFAPQYAIYFFTGLVLGSHGLERGLLAADGMLARRWNLWLAGAPAAFLLWIIPTALIVKGEVALPGLQTVADLGFVLSAATISLAITAVFLRFAGASWPMFDSISENAYGIYLVHYVFVIWLQYLLLGLALLAIAKAAIVFSGTLVLSWATTTAACRISIGARVMGGKRRQSATAP